MVLQIHKVHTLGTTSKALVFKPTREHPSLSTVVHSTEIDCYDQLTPGVMVDARGTLDPEPFLRLKSIKVVLS